VLGRLTSPGTHDFVLPRLVARCPGLADAIGEIWKRKRLSPQKHPGRHPGVPTFPQPPPGLTHALGAQALVLELLVGGVGVDDEVLHAGAGELLLRTTPGVRGEAAARACRQRCRLPAAPAAVWGQERGAGGWGGGG